MTPLLALWMPIAVAAVLVFLLSWFLHAVLKYHASDFRPLPKEDETLAALRAAGLTPGLYHFPHCPSMKEMQSPAMIEKMRTGPVGMATIFPSGPPAMGRYLALWFVHCLLIGLFVAYLSSRTLAPGTDYLQVFRVAGTAAFMAYGLSQFVNSIWKGQPWGATAKEIFDGLLYGLVTGGAFGWLWPR
ncbi:MAG: hypothetical protein F9K18_02075 [Thermoanaerobaculia bacterium]|nr:MAG: hypothetical protein F9K18_02075 [Thermoanaerobaculia bacterium]